MVSSLEAVANGQYLSSLNSPPPQPPLPVLRDALARWENLRREMARPSFELDVESFGLLRATFQELRRLGYAFDGVFVELMNVLQLQSLATESGTEDWEIAPDPEDFDEDVPDSEEELPMPAARPVMPALLAARRRSLQPRKEVA